MATQYTATQLRELISKAMVLGFYDDVAEFTRQLKELEGTN